MRISLAIGVMAFVAAGGALAGPPSDQARIVSIERQQAAAWNAHDSAAYAALFTADADTINVLGWHWRSRAELQTKLGRAFKSVFARSRLSIESVSVEFVKPDVAVAFVRWSMTGAQSPTTTGANAPEHGIQTQVLIRRKGEWRISHFQNTNSVPEMPFPDPS